MPILSYDNVMGMSSREVWSAVHGILAGGLFLLAYSGGMISLVGLSEAKLSKAGLQDALRKLKLWTAAMAVIAWVAVILGAYVVYPWYRATPPAGANLADFPQRALMADASKAAWHNFGMEWKEHVAWFAPLLATTVAYIVAASSENLAKDATLRRLCAVLFTLAFLAATAAGLFGALITKAAPVH